MFELRQILSEEDWERVKLVIVGGCRGKEDWDLVQDLKDLTKYLSVEDNVQFLVNLPFPDLLQEFSKATVGMHTMHQEHFGIGEGRLLASVTTMLSRSGRNDGCRPAHHRSPLRRTTYGHSSRGPGGGDLLDDPGVQGARNGFLAVTAQEYAAHVAYVLSMEEGGREQVAPLASDISHHGHDGRLST